MLRKVSADGKLPAKAILTAQKEKGAQSISVSTVEGWRVGEVQDFIIFTTDGENVVPGSVSSWTGVPAANGDIAELTLTGGIDILYPIGAVVMPTATSSWANEVIGALLVAHNSDGSLKSEAIPKQEIPDKSITADKINLATLKKYSRDEVDTGFKWIDSRPIYRKVIQGTVDLLGGENRGKLEHGIIGLTAKFDIVSISGEIALGGTIENSGTKQTLPHIEGNHRAGIASVTPTNIEIAGTYPWRSCGVSIVIEYVK